MRWFTRFSRCIYVSPSGYKVFDNLFFRWLTFEITDLQTVILKFKPQKPVLYYIPTFTLLARTRPGPCCLLGLGGAGVAHVLYSSGFTTTAVELSKEVIQIAQSYFMTEQIPNLTVEHQSANTYLEHCSKQYFHILIDMYTAHNFPEECNNEHFFFNCSRVLAPQGFLSINLPNAKEQLPILQLIKKYFKNTLCIPINKCGNLVIHASNHEQKDWLINTVLATKEISKISWVSTWGCVGR